MLYELWIIINMLLALVGVVYAAGKDSTPMAIGWFICFTGWLGLMR